MPTPLSWTTILTVLLVASGCGRSETDMPNEQEVRDLQAIEDLHRRDRNASLAGDPSALLALWSDDPAVLPPGTPILQGHDNVEAMLDRYNEASANWETVEYEQDFVEVEIVGDYAWDWGTYRGRSRHRETGREVSSSGKLLRILKRAPDGSWRVHRSIWNVNPDAETPEDS